MAFGPPENFQETASHHEPTAAYQSLATNVIRLWQAEQVNRTGAFFRRSKATERNCVLRRRNQILVDSDFDFSAFN
jgi:hypothetical protein